MRRRLPLQLGTSRWQSILFLLFLVRPVFKSSSVWNPKAGTSLAFIFHEHKGAWCKQPKGTTNWWQSSWSWATLFSAEWLLLIIKFLLQWNTHLRPYTPLLICVTPVDDFSGSTTSNLVDTYTAQSFKEFAALTLPTTMSTTTRIYPSFKYTLMIGICRLQWGTPSITLSMLI